MSGDNVIPFAARRGERSVPDDLAARDAKRSADRREEAIGFLRKLRTTARIPKEDRPVVARNLGRLVAELEPEHPKHLAKKILQSGWELSDKRKRYIRFPNEVAGPSESYAASGLEFAGIIERFASERAKRGLGSAQAIAATVYDVLKGTSFRRPSRFQIRDDANEDEAAFLISAMEQVFDKLADEVDLAEHFERVNKYPIFPNCAYYESSKSLGLVTKYDGNDIYRWDWMTDEDQFDLQNIPWWAPRCLIGQLYIPFESKCLHVACTRFG